MTSMSQMLYSSGFQADFLFFLCLLLCVCSASHGLPAAEDGGAEQESGRDALQLDSSADPRCGNGIIESGETCDDGNADDGDSCSSDCSSVDLCPGGALDGDFQFPNRHGQGLAFLAECTRIAGDLILADPELESLDPLRQLREVQGDLTIGFSDKPSGYDIMFQDGKLADLQGLSALRSVGGNLTIKRSNVLTSLAGLDQLTRVGGDLTIDENESLTSLDGLDHLTAVGGSLGITHCGLLADLGALSNLQTIGGKLYIQYNRRLASENLADLFVGNIVSHLTNLDGFENLRSVGGDVSIEWNPVLADLEGLSGLETVGGSLELSGLACSDLNALRNLKSVGRDLIILENEVLQALFEPHPSLTIGKDLRLKLNELLPTCEAFSFREQLLQNGFSGAVSICGTLEDTCGGEPCP